MYFFTSSLNFLRWTLCPNFRQLSPWETLAAVVGYILMYLCLMGAYIGLKAIRKERNKRKNGATLLTPPPQLTQATSRLTQASQHLSHATQQISHAASELFVPSRPVTRSMSREMLRSSQQELAPSTRSTRRSHAMF